MLVAALGRAVLPNSCKLRHVNALDLNGNSLCCCLYPLLKSRAEGYTATRTMREPLQYSCYYHWLKLSTRPRTPSQREIKADIPGLSCTVTSGGEIDTVSIFKNWAETDISDCYFSSINRYIFTHYRSQQDIKEYEVSFLTKIAFSIDSVRADLHAVPGKMMCHVI